MSFDLKLANGDLSIGANGDLEVVFDEDKLRQDLLKIIMTPTNSNKNYAWYGSPLTTRTIGKVLDPSIFKSEVESSLTYSIDNLKALQRDQERDGQFITPKEAIAQVLDIGIARDVFDPRGYNISVVIKTRQASIVNETLTLTT